MLLFERQGESVYDRTQNLEQLGDAIEALRFVNELEEDIVDGASNVGSQIEEFPVDTMKGSLEEVSLAWVFGVEEFE